MSKKPHYRAEFGALNVFSEIEAIPDQHEDLTSGSILEVSSKAPAPALLEKKSDLSFFDRLADRLFADGLGDLDFCRTALYLVATQPRLSAVKPGEARGTNSLLQVLCVKDSDHYTYLLILKLEISKIKPPQVVAESIEILIVEPADPMEIASALPRFESWRLEYSVRSVTSPLGQPGDVAWHGDPSKIGYTSTPQDWEDVVKGIGLTLGLQIHISRSTQSLRATNIHARARTLVLPTGAQMEPGDLARFTDSTTEPVRIGTAGSTFDALASDFRVTLVSLFLEDKEPDARVEIANDAVIYHRKIGDSRGGYDTFDAGSATPCTHGASSHVPWRSADKAAKGMARRYSNFEPSWLYHCKKFPNCGVYSVRGPRER